jgi:PHD/YefM family antitoxin component YafN of YafNO toxin-antitoxin module
MFDSHYTSYANSKMLIMKSFTTVELLRDLPTVTQAIARGPVAITRHRKPRYVLMAVEDYKRLVGLRDPRQVFRSEETPEEVKDELLGGLDALISELDADGD